MQNMKISNQTCPKNTWQNGLAIGSKSAMIRGQGPMGLTPSPHLSSFWKTFSSPLSPPYCFS